MAKIVLTGDTFIDLSEPGIPDLWLDSSSIFESNDVAVVDIGDEDGGAFVFEGSGFGNFDSHGYAREGTIERFTYVVPGAGKAAWTGIDIDAGAFQEAVKDGDSATFAELLWGENDKVTIGDAGAAFNGFAGNDQITSKNGLDRLFGGEGNDVLKSGGDADQLTGGLGKDTLTGGSGPDQFIFEDVAESTAGSIDLIKDLSAEDAIDLVLIDADTSTGGDDGFVLAAFFSGTAGELVLTYNAVNDRTRIEGDVDGDGDADLIINADGDHSAHGNFFF
jgi:Ca2+-binding RTX toxin-like protein